MKREALARAIRDRSKLSGHFVLRSGRTSDTYFDKYLFESDPDILRAIAEQLAERVPADTEILCGLEMGGIPVVTALSQVTRLPCAFLRKARKPHGTMKYAEGPDLSGRRILLVEDVVSSGGAIIDAARMLRADGISVDRALCVIDRQTGGLEALDAAGIMLTALFTMREIDAEGAHASSGAIAPAPVAPGATRHIALTSLLVREYDEAIAFYVDTLGFELLEDTHLPGQDKRWVVVAPPGPHQSALLLARATDEAQSSRVGNQAGGRVFVFLHTDDFWRDYEAFRAKGVEFVRAPKTEAYGTVAVFRDLYGNLWDLLQPSVERTDR